MKTTLLPTLASKETKSCTPKLHQCGVHGKIIEGECNLQMDGWMDTLGGK